MNKDKAINILNRQLNIVDNLLIHNSNFRKWKRDTQIAIENILGLETRHISDFNKISYNVTFSGSITLSSETVLYQERERERARERGLQAAKSILKSFIQEIEEYWNNKEDISYIKSHLSTTERIELICNRFHKVALQMQSRNNNRATLEINDEYDVQDLFHWQLISHGFDDVRTEESNPSHAGSNSRADFLLKPEETMIEIKKTRQGLNHKKLGEELTLDINKYQPHPDCKTLVCFVYDPEARIGNPRGLEKDLEQITDKIEVKVLIRPE